MTLESCSTDFPQAACTVTRTSPVSAKRIVTELFRDSKGCGDKQRQGRAGGCAQGCADNAVPALREWGTRAWRGPQTPRVDTCPSRLSRAFYVDTEDRNGATGWASTPTPIHAPAPLSGARARLSSSP